MKKIFFVIITIIALSNSFADTGRKLPKIFVSQNPIRLHTKLKKTINETNWNKLSSNSFSSGILTIKGNKCYIKWHDFLCPLGFSCETMGKPEKLIYKAKEIFENKNTCRLIFNFKNTEFNILLTPKNNILDIKSFVSSTSNLAVRIGWQIDIPTNQIFWHKNIYEKILADKNGDYKTTVQSNIGMKGEQSIYPFAVISSSNDILAAFVDVTEPVFYTLNFHKAKKTSLQFFFDTMLSEVTPKANLCSAQSGAVVILKGDNSFRRSLKKYYDMYPKIFESQPPSYSGNWLPFITPAAISNVDDFSFSAHECHNADLKFNSQHNIGTFYYVEPWLAWIKMPQSLNRTSSSVINILNKMLITSNNFASAVFLNGQRDKENKLLFRFLKTPWCDGAKIRLFPVTDTFTTKKFPVNQAQYIWNSVRKKIEDKQVAGIYLDSMNANTSLSYDTNQLAASDFPAIFAFNNATPALHGCVALFEFCEPLAEILHKNNLQIMGNFPIDTFAFIPRFVDIPGQETVWFWNNNYQPMSSKKMFYCRTMSGQKPYLLLQCCNFNKFKPYMKKYFARCAAMGFFPSMFSSDSANNPYWESPELYNRDRKLFKKYLPIIKLLANAGWEPIPQARSNSNIWLEQFGSPETEWWLTLYNPTEEMIRGTFQLTDDEKKRDAYLPLSRTRLTRDSLGNYKFALPAGEVFVINLKSE